MIVVSNGIKTIMVGLLLLLYPTKLILQRQCDLQNQDAPSMTWSNKSTLELYPMLLKESNN